ncbi:MAG: hypothetical protein JWQ81_5914 [Amycolatopsis sp.]|jgi:hypothetical protein|uniref:hypothetical protein n=1 Tax=Amycolatopsis sp. TaxID=37632 RepID=UPI0026339EBC|nr:hypothetical protein [Amycolatopsis sp.]MCU1685175.1 hypothetical protein [Amycolatopsis sp.]
MDFSSLGDITRVTGEVATGLKATRTLFAAIPAGQKDKGAATAARKEAYSGFLAATGDLSTWVTHLGVLSLAMQQRQPFAWRHMSTLLGSLSDLRSSQAAYFAALSEVRVMGASVPRAAAEEVTAVLSELFSSLPVGDTPAEREARTSEAALWQARLGEAIKDFVLAVRVDIGTATKPRRRFWLVGARPKVIEEWPGGWPGKTVTLAIEDRPDTSD